MTDTSLSTALLTNPLPTCAVVLVPNVSVAKVSICWLGKLKEAELSFVASLNAKAVISDLTGCKSTDCACWVTLEDDNLASAKVPDVIFDAGKSGTIIQNTNTVGSAKTKVGGTILYKDLSGTATLGTDLKVYFTCNGGTNWTEASSYSAITPVYSTGVKQVRLGETTCTSGTDVRYKVEWANQSQGSKETQLHGIGTNY